MFNFKRLSCQICPTCLQAQAQAKAQSQVLPQEFAQRSGSRGGGGDAAVHFTVLSAEGKGPSKKDAKHFASKQLLCKLFPSTATPEEALGAATSAKEQYTMRKRAKRLQERPERGRLGVDSHGTSSAGTSTASAGGVGGSKKRPRQDRNADTREADGGNSDGSCLDRPDNGSRVRESKGWRVERIESKEKPGEGEGEGACEGEGEGKGGGGGSGGGSVTRQEQRQEDIASSSQRKRVLPSDIEAMTEQLRSSTRLHAAEDGECTSPSTTVAEAMTTAVGNRTAPGGESSHKALNDAGAAANDNSNGFIGDTVIGNTRVRKRCASDLGISEVPEVLTDQLNNIGKIWLHELEES